MLLRAYPEAGSSAVVVEARLLTEHLPVDASQRLLDESSNSSSEIASALPQLLYYQDTSVHSAQEGARKAWRVQPAAVKRSVSYTSTSALKAAKKVKLSGETEVDSSQQAKRKNASSMTGTC